MHPFYYSAKKYPSWCTCCVEPKYLNNRFNAYYHIRRKPMAPKKQKANPKSSPSGSSNSNDHTPQSIGKKREAPINLSPELELFYKNCDPKGIIFTALADPTPNFFEKTIENTLNGFSTEEKMILLHDFLDKSTTWKEEKKKIQKHYDEVYEAQVDQDWKDYIEDMKKRACHDGHLGEYIKSNQVLTDEIGKLQSIIEVIVDEQSVREKVEKEKIWSTVIKQIETTELRVTPHLVITNTPRQQSSLSSLVGSRTSVTREVSGGEAAAAAPDAGPAQRWEP
jgi:hypothetical protein